MASAFPPVPDRLARALSEGGDVAVRAVTGTALVAEAAARHGTGPTATAALGRALLGALLLGAGGKDGESVQLRLRGDGPLRSVLAIADGEGGVRGNVGTPVVELPLRGGRLDVAGALGLGELSVVRHRPGWREPYTGIVPLVSGEIAQDLALYLTESEQTPSAVALGVYLEPDGTVRGAAGFLAHALPGARDEALAVLERNVAGFGSPSERVRDGETAEELALALLDGIGGRVLESRPVGFRCRCDEARVLRAVALLGREALRELCDAGEPVEVRCELCGERYAVDPERARALVPDA
jgi:molecular chaperone Hsp33